MCQSKAHGGRRCGDTPAARASRKYGAPAFAFTMALPDGVPETLAALRECGDPLIVGGAVRDALKGASSKDTDIEVYGTTMDDLVKTLRGQGFAVDEVGRAFGVLKVSKRGVVRDLDVSVPRRDNAVGAGHRGFEVDTESPLTVTEAAARRDFTINALSYAPEFGAVIDPFNGTKDLKNGTLRHVSEAFSEDPLRVLRGFQFAGRFDMTLDPRTASLCRELRPRFEELAVERVREEWAKFYTKSRDHAAGVRALQAAGWDDIAPGLRDALRVPSVLPSLHNVAFVRPEDRAAVGAAVIAAHVPDEERKGFLRTTMVTKESARAAADLAAMDPYELGSAYARKTTAARLHRRGFTFARYREFAEVTEDTAALRVAEAATTEFICDGPEPPLLQGRDVLPFVSRKPGPWLGELVAESLDRQYRGEFADKDAAVAWAVSRAESMS